MVKSARIAVVSVDASIGGWNGICTHIRNLARLERRSPRHSLEEHPAKADLILLTDLRPDGNFRNLRLNAWWRRRPEDTFAIYYSDFPPRYLPGIYPCMEASRLNLHRFVGGAWTYFNDRYHYKIPDFSPADLSGEWLGSLIATASHPIRAQLARALAGHREFKVEVKPFHRSMYRLSKSPGQEFFEHYWDICRRSRFVLCPRGIGPSSPRLFEVMQMGLAPVVLADKLILPRGPDWDSFLVRIPEGDLASVPERLAELAHSWRERGALARRAWETFFCPTVHFDWMVDQLLFLKSVRRFPEARMSSYWPFFRAHRWIEAKIRGLARRFTNG